MAASTLDVKIVKVTPAQAKRWLEKNDVNRNVRAKLVNAYRRDMEAGRWEMTAEPIQISRTGMLLNGQHRLTALAGSNLKSLDFVVATGLPDESQAMMDQGKGRSVRDALLIQHGEVKNVALVASMARWVTLAPVVSSELTPNVLRNKVTTAEALAAFEEFPELPEAATRAQTIRLHTGGSPSAIGYAWIQMHRVNPEAANEFFAGMMDMEWSFLRDPRKAALRRIQSFTREEPTTIETGLMLVSVLTRAYNAWRKGEEMDSINVRSRKGPIPPVSLVKD